MAEVPKWLNEGFFKEILQKSENNNTVDVVELTFQAGSKVGDHYASIMFRANIRYNVGQEKVEKSLIVKVAPTEEGFQKQLIDNMGLFKTEIKIYSEIIPLYHEQLRAINDNTQLGCKCLYASSEPHDVLIFEDLTTKGYKIPDSWDGNVNLALTALQKLAKWHAVGYKLNVDGNSTISSFRKNIFTTDNIKEMPMFKGCIDMFSEMLHENDDLKQYADIFDQHIVADELFDAIRKIFEENGDLVPVNIEVLNHGDFHIKNLMYTEDKNGSLDDVMLIDFQICLWGPSALDLTYMFYMMLDNECRIERREEIIYEYFKTFSETLTQLGLKENVPKLTDLYKDLMTCKSFEIMMLTCMLPMVTSIRDKDATDPHETMNNPETKRVLYKKPNYLKQVRRLLPYLLHKGYFN